ncbi:hypothetical protein BURK1_03175 [Burkholderiales bacterium]|nr:hypothetical protein BURK1_03175 [Burkholderiales bacterium]
MNVPRDDELKVDLMRSDGTWRVVLERAGQRQEFGNLDELIRYLQGLAADERRPPRGLR